MNGFLALGLMILIVLAALGLSVLFLRRDRRKVNDEFDERQVQAQGQGASLAAIVAMVYYGALVAFLPEGLPHTGLRLLLFLGLVLDLLVAGTYAVLSDAYVGRSNKGRSAGIGFLVVGLLNLSLVGLILVLEEGMLSLSADGGGYRTIMLGVSFTYLGILLLVKDRQDRKEDDDGEE